MAKELGAGTGSDYPNSIDLDSTVETAITTVRADVPNDLADAIIKIETELGTDPAGTQTDVKTFLQNGHETDGSHKYIFKAWEPPYNCPVDGTSDCKTAIQAAIDAAEAVGGTVVLPHVDMVLESGLTITDSIKLLGLGAYGSVLKPDDNFACITVASTADDKVNGGLELKYFGIDYGGNAGISSYGISFSNVATARRARAYSISNLRLLNHYYGIWDAQSIGGGSIKNIYSKTTVANSRCIIATSSSTGGTLSVENCYLGGGGSSSIALNIADQHGFNISNVTITGYANAFEFTDSWGAVNGAHLKSNSTDSDGLIYLTTPGGNYTFNGLKTESNTIADTGAVIHAQSGVHAVFNSPRFGGDAKCNDTTASGATSYLFELESGVSEIIVNGWGDNALLDDGGGGASSNFATGAGIEALTINVGAQDQIIAKSANYSINAWIDKHIQASGSGTTITLPNATQNKGKVFTIERNDAANVITVDVDTSGNIGDQATVTMNGDGDTMTVRSDGTDWQFVSYIGLIF